MLDVLVVGAGPTGSQVARLLAGRGHRVLLLEEHPVVGRPVQCAGLVTPRTFDHTPFAIGALWQNDLRGGIVHSPDGTKVAFESAAVQAQAMDRAGFDQKMADAAVDAGAQLLLGTKAVAYRRDTHGVRVTLQDRVGRRDVDTRLLVGADGIRSGVARAFGFPPVAEVVAAYEAELSGVHIGPGQEHMIPMFAGRAQAPGFFSWIIPVGHGRARAGIAVAPGMNEAAAKAYYERMFKDPQSAPFLKDARPEELIIGGIPLGLRSRLVQDRVVLVGDAAGMAKPTSGGGIYYGLVAAEDLARVAHRRLADDRLGAGDLAAYERAVRRRVAPELRKGERLRAIYKRFQDRDLDDLARLLSTPAARAVIESQGDIDYPSRLVWPLLRAEPRLGALFARVVLRGGP